MRRTLLRFFFRAFCARALPVALLWCMSCLCACANDDNTPPGPKALVTRITDAAPGDSARGDAVAPSSDASLDQGAGSPVRCTQAELDAADTTTSATVAIAFPTAPGPMQYTNHCIKVKVGTKITFMGGFSFHPLEPNGGDSPTPIPPLTSAGASLEITVSAAGTFGYECNFHPGTMFGAIQVVP